MKADEESRIHCQQRHSRRPAVGTTAGVVSRREKWPLAVAGCPVIALGVGAFAARQAPQPTPLCTDYALVPWCARNHGSTHAINISRIVAGGEVSQ